MALADIVVLMNGRPVVGGKVLRADLQETIYAAQNHREVHRRSGGPSPLGDEISPFATIV